MTLHLDNESLLAVLLMLIAAAGVFLSRRSSPRRSLRLDVRIQPAGASNAEKELVIRVENTSRGEITLDQAGLTCTNKLAYSGRAWQSNPVGLKYLLQPASAPFEIRLDYTLLLTDLRALAATLKDAWIIDAQDTIYVARVPKAVIQQIMADLQAMN